MDQTAKTPHTAPKCPDRDRTEASKLPANETPKRAKMQVFTDFAAI